MLAMNTRLMSPAEVAEGDAVGFSLENGAALLGTAFADVALRRYEDRLVVTESEQLLAYLMSSPQVQKKLTGLDPAERQEHVARIRALIDEQLEVHGQIVVTKDFRVFIVRRVWS